MNATLPFYLVQSPPPKKNPSITMLIRVVPLVPKYIALASNSSFYLVYEFK